jgi:putative ABC transport system permease protein
VEALPGVEAAGLVNRLPLGGAPNNAVSVILDSFTAAPGKEPMVDRRIATPDYFRTMGIPLLAGRPFSPADGADAARVALVNHTMARTFWPEGTALGRRVRIKLLTGDGPWLTIVGVVGNVRHHGLEQEAHPELWVPAAQAPVQGMVLVVRTGGGPALATSQIRAAVSELDPELPVPIASLESVVAASVRAPRSRTLLMAGFAGLALLLAAVGIYAVVSYTVGGLAREIGIRIALGARRSEVIRLVIGQNLVLTAIGIALGLAGAVMVTRYLDRFLFGVTPLDAATYVGASVLLGAVATLASYIPARRATRVDPLVALRAE